MKHLIMQTAPELPAVNVPVCGECHALAQSPNPECSAPHGAADPRLVLAHLCPVIGHVLTAGDKSFPRCLRCRKPRSEVVS